MNKAMSKAKFKLMYLYLLVIPIFAILVIWILPSNVSIEDSNDELTKSKGSHTTAEGLTGHEKRLRTLKETIGFTGKWTPMDKCTDESEFCKLVLKGQTVFTSYSFGRTQCYRPSSKDLLTSVQLVSSQHIIDESGKRILIDEGQWTPFLPYLKTSTKPASGTSFMAPLAGIDGNPPVIVYLVRLPHSKLYGCTSGEARRLMDMLWSTL